jgi:hypothetical protein
MSFNRPSTPVHLRIPPPTAAALIETYTRQIKRAMKFSVTPEFVVSIHGRFSRRSRASQMRIVSGLRGWSRRSLAITFPNSISSVPSLVSG